MYLPKPPWPSVQRSSFAEELEGHDEIIRNIEQYLEDSEAFFYFEEALKLQRHLRRRSNLHGVR